MNLFEFQAAVGDETENGETGNGHAGRDAAVGAGENEGEAGHKETRKERYEVLYELCTEESVGKTEPEINEGSDLEDQ